MSGLLIVNSGSVQNALSHRIPERPEHNDTSTAAQGLVRSKDEKEYCDEQTNLDDGVGDDPEN
ncbi:hypothetical protein AUI06_01740 [archaeon 13_2_20CM_2_52_21]|nr:MAG: hypothetical protein AUI06_01740 [archaeon 13_2_20CM_2_52_21]